MKKDRHGKILEIIASGSIETQDDLINELERYSFHVTQATISRDIRELKLTKTLMPSGKYVYTIPTETTDSPLRFNMALASSLITVSNSLNIVVVKTTPGMAQAVAVVIDKNDNREILGCVAGDDTILIVSSGVDEAERLAASIRMMIAGNDKH